MTILSNNTSKPSRNDHQIQSCFSGSTVVESFDYLSDGASLASKKFLTEQDDNIIGSKNHIEEQEIIIELPVIKA